MKSRKLKEKERTAPLVRVLLQQDEHYDSYRARIEWQRSLSRVDLLSLVQDYRRGVIGQDVEDAVDEYMRRYPTKPKPRRPANFGVKPDGRATMSSYRNRCPLHRHMLPPSGCNRCLSIILPKKLELWSKAWISRTPCAIDHSIDGHEAIRRAS